MSTPSTQAPVAIVTGASAGIGLSTAMMLAARGYRLLLTARRIGPLEDAKRRILGERADAEVHLQAGDVQDTAHCRGLVETAVETWGRLDVLVNNAGAHFRGNFESHDEDAFAAMVDVNLRAPIVLTRLALPHLMRVRHGAVVNVASLAGFIPLPGSAVYSATKFGLRAFSRALAEELRDTPVTISLVSPGPVSTGFILDDLASVSDLTLSQPMSTPDEIAELVLECIDDGALERSRPQASAFLATLGYLAPGLSRRLRPLMQRRGQRERKRQEQRS